MLVHYHNLFLFWVVNKVRMRHENPWILRVHPRPWKSLQISAIHSWSMKVLEFLLTLVFIVWKALHAVIHTLQYVGSRMLTSAFALFSGIYIIEKWATIVLSGYFHCFYSSKWIKKRFLTFQNMVLDFFVSNSVRTLSKDIFIFLNHRGRYCCIYSNCNNCCMHTTYRTYCLKLSPDNDFNESQQFGRLYKFIF